MLLALALNGSIQAQSFVYAANPTDAPELAASILDQKLITYRAFNQTHPGYAGFLPIFESNSTSIRAAQGYENKISAAENG